MDTFQITIENPLIFAVDNAEDILSSGGVKELIRISVESSREDIRNLAKKTLRSNPAFQAEIQVEI